MTCLPLCFARNWQHYLKALDVQLFQVHPFLTLIVSKRWPKKLCTSNHSARLFFSPLGPWNLTGRTSSQSAGLIYCPLGTIILNSRTVPLDKYELSAICLTGVIFSYNSWKCKGFVHLNPFKDFALTYSGHPLQPLHCQKGL